jgi:MoxR-like ATPase
MNKSCMTCPSYLSTTEQVVSKFKKATGAPMCGRFGKVLGRPGATEEQLKKIATHYGSNCSSHGEFLPPLPTEFDLRVVLPDPSAMNELPDDDPKRQHCATCASCTKFVPARIVAEQLGWSTGLCSAKGTLVLPHREAFEGRTCGMRAFGVVRNSTAANRLLPEFEDAFNLSSDPVVTYFKQAAGPLVEPHDYPTDKDVSPAETAQGIRAWRKFTDPAGSGSEVFLPVYDPAHFDEVERGKIPRSGDQEHPELYVDHFGGAYLAGVTWTELDETPALWGQAGTGKTDFFRYLAWLMCLPFERISITATTELDDLMGKTLFTQGVGTHFQYGRLPQAWIKPCVLVIDEPNVGLAEVWHALRPLTDNSKQLVLDANKAEHLDRHADCYLGMAMNSNWDVRNVGTNQIGDADASRLFHIQLDLPPEQLEREIIMARVKLDGWEIDEARLKAIMSTTIEIRALCDEGTLPITWGVRPNIKVARALRWFEPVVAYRRAIADYLEPEARAAILDVVKAHFK